MMELFIYLMVKERADRGSIRNKYTRVDRDAADAQCKIFDIHGSACGRSGCNLWTHDY